MKSISLVAFLALGGIAIAATTNSFEGTGTTVTTETFGDPGGASIQPTGGNPGGYLQLTNNVNNQNNWATFDRSDPGTFLASYFSFQFRVDNLSGNGGADGFSFNYYNTGTFGATGGVGFSRFTPEDPSLSGVLGFGFDTWGNGAPNDPDPATSGNYSEISLFYNGALINRVDDTRLLTPSFNIKDTLWHTVYGSVDFAGGTVSMNVDGTTIFDRVSVPLLAPFESRVGYAGRTGNANERASIDNLNVQFVPEPGIIGAVALGSLVALRRRRR